MTTHSSPTKPPMPQSSGFRDDETGLERLIFFSDAVFAIAITLLALEIRLPVEAHELTNAELLSALFAIWPKYLSFIISFLVIGSFWMGHHRKFSVIKRYNNRLMFLNLLMLMCVAFIPFPTAVLSESGNRTATIFYALSMVTTGLLSGLVWWYAAHHNRLTHPPLSTAEVRRGLINNLIVPAIFLVSIGVAFVNPDLAKFTWILIVPASAYMRS